MTAPTPLSQNPADAHSRGLHRVALLTTCAVLALMFIGAGVTSKGAGMAYPDWPTSDGHLVNPPGWWQGDLTRWEHAHRLMGWTVGFLAIVLAGVCWRCGGKLRLVGVATLAAIIVQGVLGGLRVTEISTTWAVVHGVWGQVCFCLACMAALLTSRAWAASCGALAARRTVFFRRGCWLGLACVFAQLVAGAIFRHFGSRGALIAHLLGAVVVILVLSWLAMWVMEQYGGNALLSRLGRTLAVLIGLQMILGGFSFLVTVMGVNASGFIGWALPSTHLLVGAMILACVLSLTMAGYRVLREADATALQVDGHSATAASL